MGCIPVSKTFPSNKCSNRIPSQREKHIVGGDGELIWNEMYVIILVVLHTSVYTVFKTTYEVGIMFLIFLIRKRLEGTMLKVI